MVNLQQFNENNTFASREVCKKHIYNGVCKINALLVLCSDIGITVVKSVSFKPMQTKC